MLDKVDHADATAGHKREDELSTGKALERQVLMDLLVACGGFGLAVTAVVLAVQALSPG